MRKPILVLTNQYPQEIEYRIDRDYQVDLQAAANRRVPFTYTPVVKSEATADIAMLLLLGASRRAYGAQELVRTGVWRPLSPNMLLGWQVGGKVLGIIRRRAEASS